MEAEMELSSPDDPAAPAPAPLQTPPADVKNDPLSPFPLFDLPRELRDAVYDYALVPVAAFKLPHKSPPGEEEAEDDGLGAALANTGIVSSILPFLGHASTLPAGLPELLSRQAQLPPSLSTNVSFRPRLAMLMSSKAIKAEYEKRANLAMTLVIKDNENYSFQFITLPPQVTNVHHIELHLILFCHHCRIMTHQDDYTCQATHEIQHHVPWIQHLLRQLPHLRSTTVVAHLCYDGIKLDAKTPHGKKNRVPCEPIVRRRIRAFYAFAKLKRLTLVKYDFQAQPDLEGPGIAMLEWRVGEGEKIAVEVKKKGDADDGVAKGVPETGVGAESGAEADSESST